MESKGLELELGEAYKSLEKAERKISNLLAERKQLLMTLNILDTAGFIKDGKLEEARGFSQAINS